MKHARPDYNRIQDPAGLIPEDEPVILFRGQDVFAPAALRLYADILESNNAGSELIGLIRSQATEMENWRVHKVPDLPNDMTAQIAAVNVALESNGANMRLVIKPETTPEKVRQIISDVVSQVAPMSKEDFQREVKKVTNLTENAK